MMGLKEAIFFFDSAVLVVMITVADVRGRKRSKDLHRRNLQSPVR